VLFACASLLISLYVRVHFCNDGGSASSTSLQPRLTQKTLINII